MEENQSKPAIIPSLLGVAFVVLKLCHVIDWSWWWITLPFYGPILLGIILKYLKNK